MKVVAVIPARYGSTRFPGKPLARLAGKPLIQHVWERARAIPSVEAVYVATDDHRIYDAVLAFGGKPILTSREHPSGTDRVAEVCRSLDVDLVVNIQGDEPLVDGVAVDRLVRSMLADPTIGIGSLAHPIDDEGELLDPNAVKVVLNRKGDALYFTRSPIPYWREVGGPRSVRGPVTPLRHIGLYAYRRPVLLRLAAWPPTPLEQTEALEQLRALEHGEAIRILVVERPAPGVDTPEDLERVRRILVTSTS